MASLASMTVWDVFKRGVKKVIMECASVKFWAACACGYANWHIISVEHKADLFLVTTFCVLIGIREAADLLQRKQSSEGGGNLK